MTQLKFASILHPISILALTAIHADAVVAQVPDGIAAPSGVNLPPRPRGKIILVEEDLPPTAVVAQREGRVKVEFTVGTNGRVTDCKTVVTSGFWQLDELTCYLIQRRARYYPATDSNGGPISGKADQAVTWVAPSLNSTKFLADYSAKAAAGDADAMVALGMLYERGSVGPRDYVTASMWYRKGADGGNAEGMYRLGQLHLRGLGVAKSEVVATNLFRLSEQKGNLDAKRTLFELSPEGKRQAQAADQARYKAIQEQFAQRKAAAELSVKTKNCVPVAGKCISLDSFVFIQMGNNGQPREKIAYSNKESCEFTYYEGYYCQGMLARDAWRLNYHFMR